jgi:hypothetical protein
VLTPPIFLALAMHDFANTSVFKAAAGLAA